MIKNSVETLYHYVHLEIVAMQFFLSGYLYGMFPKEYETIDLNCIWIMVFGFIFVGNLVCNIEQNIFTTFWIIIPLPALNAAVVSFFFSFFFVL